MVKYEVMTCYDLEYLTGRDRLKKTGYCVTEYADDNRRTMYESKWWILCFLRANRLTRELGINGYRAPLPSPKVPE